MISRLAVFAALALSADGFVVSPNAALSAPSLRSARSPVSLNMLQEVSWGHTLAGSDRDQRAHRFPPRPSDGPAGLIARLTTPP